ncbi:MAG: flagellin [Parvularculaceae bacterium]
MSLLTNESSMVALATLRGINRNLAQVQQEISTGKSVSNARDNASIFAITTVMQSDVDSFKAISGSLNLGSSTTAVARSASEQVTDLLQEIKSLVVAAQEDNVDRTKIQTDVGQLRDQISSIVNAAQFNGLNLLKGGGSISILSSLDRASDGTVTASKISIAKFDLQLTQQVFGTGAATVTATEGGVAVPGTIADTETATVTYTAAAITEGESFRITLGGTDFDYVARDGDTLNNVAAALKTSIDAAGLTGIAVSVTNVADPTTTDSVISIANTSGAAVTIAEAGGSGGTAGGGLATLSTFDVSTSTGAASALTDVEALIQTGIDAAAQFGSSQKRIDIQNEFITNLTDALRTGIGALTDANLEEASARLQSLQVQQQLSVQALTIANAQPQVLLNLFR